MQSRDLVHSSVFVAALFALAGIFPQWSSAQQPSQAAPGAMQVQPLSRSALEALVAPYSLYPDAVIERVFDAAQYPSILHEAARAGASAQSRANWPESVQWVAKEPPLLKQLVADIALTARLGVAAKEQLEDTWRAVDSVRLKMQAATPSQAQEESDEFAEEPAQTVVAGSGVVAPVIPYSAAVAAALWTDAVWHEVRAYHQAYHQTYGATQTITTTSPYGTATTMTTTQTSRNGHATVTTGSGTAQVTGPGGSNTDTAGDGQIGGTSQTERARPSSSLGRPQSVQGDARFEQFNSALNSRLNSAGNRSGNLNGHSNVNRFARPGTSPGTASIARPSADARSAQSFGRPSSLRSGSAGAQKPSRNPAARGSASRSRSRTPTRSSGSRSVPSRSRGGRRGRR